MKSRPFPRTLIVLLVFIALVNALATYYFWYWRMRWFDMPVHFLSGLWVAGTVIWFRFFSHKFLNRPSSYPVLLGWGIATAFLAGLSWEVYEFSVSIATSTVPNDICDTLSDLVCDMAGGALAALIVGVRNIR